MAREFPQYVWIAGESVNQADHDFRTERIPVVLFQLQEEKRGEARMTPALAPEAPLP